jgi:hypothetical protein
MGARQVDSYAVRILQFLGAAEMVTVPVRDNQHLEARLIEPDLAQTWYDEFVDLLRIVHGIEQDDPVIRSDGKDRKIVAAENVKVVEDPGVTFSVELMFGSASSG